MNPERWRRIEEVFRTVIDHPTAERDALLTQVCGEDEELRQQVTSLLACETAEDFLHDPIRRAALSITSDPGADLTGERIGPYTVSRLIGRGGMGAVYEATRDDGQFRQRVAIKIIKRGMDTDFIRERFLRERRILASLDHPHIARLFDGGATADGLPYFVMEFVDGESITDYCVRRDLPIVERLKLFRAVCSAVQHAHQRLVIHRDLKPGNILITEDGTPKLLDFGIAKLLSPDPSEAVTRTETALRLMTPDYASPEQVRGEAVATTSDVYSLGIVLYELLTGRRPRMTEESDVDSPSRAAPARLARQLAGDLDTIVGMAMRREPERRYSSVEQFSEDLHRHLRGLPVLARRDTFAYRAGKFLRRHKAGAAIAALIVLSVIAMLGQAAFIARERDRANQEAAAAEAVTRSLVAMFEVADPGTLRGSAMTARELLDRGAERVVRNLEGQPVVQARLLDTIGQLYSKLGLYDRAQPLLEDALRLRRQAGDAAPRDVAASLNHLAELAVQQSDYPRAEALHRESLAMRRALLGGDHPEVAASMDELGTLLVLRGKQVEAEPLLRDALAMRRRLFGETHAEVASSLGGLGRLRAEQGKFSEAETLYRESLAMRRRLFGPEHLLVAFSLNNIAAMRQEQGDPAGARDLFREALATRRKLLGDEHPDTILCIANLASALQDSGEFAEAEELYRQALALRRRIYGEDHLKVSLTINNLATLLRDLGRFDEAAPLLQEALAIRRRRFGNDHHEVGATLYSIAVLQSYQGAFDEAEKTERQALDIFQKTLKPEHWMIHRSRSHLGACLVQLKRYREAEALLLPAHDGLRAAFHERHAHTQLAVSRILALYAAWGRSDKAAPYRSLPQTPLTKPKI